MYILTFIYHLKPPEIMNYSVHSWRTCI